ncbi:hypothetical protein GCM10008932_02640 [Alkalibacterium iburiense]|uniref:General stress protein 17M-like domain-containing protein n=1 Tax=Alkalibacterium iburiense TaxID=290589 RepID=A0ABN0X1Y3_9LACT
MDRHILGTFRDESDVINEVNRLINDEGYSPEELMVVIDNDHDYEEKLHTLKQVEINEIDVGESVWDRIKDTFSFGSYNTKEDSQTLEQYGVPQERSEDFMDALKDGEIILLANTDAPANNELSQVNNEVVEEDERMINMDKNNKPIDEVNTEEEEAIQSNESDNEDKEKPSNVNTSETDEENMVESIDPSQAENTRSEENASVTKNNQASDEEQESQSNEESQWTDEEEEPDLTGEEETVDKGETEHNYGNTVAEGVVKPEVKSPLNTDDKDEKDPSEESEAPESDAQYPESHEDAGMKSEE